MVILLFGPPGCGKGTQSRFITDEMKLPAISTGAMLRETCAGDSSLAHTVRELLAQGSLVSDEVVNEMLIHRLAQDDCRGGFLLDGYPRAVSQAEFLQDYLRHLGHAEPVVIHLDVDAAVLIARLSARRQCSLCSSIYNMQSKPPQLPGVCDFDGARLITRTDDRVDVVRDRMTAYERLTNPVISFYAGERYHRLNGDRAPFEISSEITNLLRERYIKASSASGNTSPGRANHI